MSAARTLPIPTRTFLGFAVVIVAFGAVAVASIVQHQRTAASLRLLPDGFLPLALDVAELRADHGVFLTRVDALLDEQDASTTRAYLVAARRIRGALVRRAVDRVRRTEALGPSAHDRAVLSAVSTDLAEVSHAYEADEARFSELDRALDSRDSDRAQRVVAVLRTHERNIERTLIHASDQLQDGIAEMSKAAEAEEQRSVQILAALLFAALLVGLIVTVLVQRTLAPLPRLQERVAAVARGELRSRLAPVRDDEIGRLTAEFERMVSALAARDQRLGEAHARLLHSERLAAIGRMAAHVTHEVRNPLSAIGLNVEMLEEELVDADPETRAMLRAIHGEVDRLTAVTEEYLRLARLPAPRLEAGDLGETVREVTDFVRKEMDAAHVTVDRQVSGDLVVLHDESQVRQALLNLLRNAREAMPDGGRIALHVSREGGEVIVRIADQGPGIPEEQLPRIFDLFYTTKERGSGLGLPLTQQIVVAHGGRIAVRRGDQGGATFELAFPVARPADGAPVSAENAAAMTQEAGE